MKRLQQDLKDPEKLQAMQEAVSRGRETWQQENGKRCAVPDPIKWIRAWKEGDSYDRELQSCF